MKFAVIEHVYSKFTQNKEKHLLIVKIMHIFQRILKNKMISQSNYQLF